MKALPSYLRTVRGGLHQLQSKSIARYIIFFSIQKYGRMMDSICRQYGLTEGSTGAASHLCVCVCVCVCVCTAVKNSQMR